jgi:hypothetical protein
MYALSETILYYKVKKHIRHTIKLKDKKNT